MWWREIGGGGDRGRGSDTSARRQRARSWHRYSSRARRRNAPPLLAHTRAATRFAIPKLTRVHLVIDKVLNLVHCERCGAIFLGATQILGADLGLLDLALAVGRQARLAEHVPLWLAAQRHHLAQRELIETDLAIVDLGLQRPLMFLSFLCKLFHQLLRGLFLGDVVGLLSVCRATVQGCEKVRTERAQIDQAARRP